MKTVGVVLAGGQSRRFGEPKALVEWQGKSFLAYSLEALQPITDETVVISHLQLPFVDVQLLEDAAQYRGMGPLAGIWTAMEAVEGDWYVVLPCDVPLVKEAVVRQLLAHCEEGVQAVVPIIEGRMQPLLACYHKSVKQEIALLLHEGKRSMKELLSRCQVRSIGEQLQLTAEAFQNVNTKEDYSNLP